MANIVIQTAVRLTADPNVRYTQGESPMAVARFSIASPRAFKKEGSQDTDFINCVAFGKTAEFIEKYLKKGTKINLQGSWMSGSYTNKEGQKIYTNEINVSNVEFCESKGSAGSSEAPENAVPTEAAGESFLDGLDALDDEGLPFN